MPLDRLIERRKGEIEARQDVPEQQRGAAGYCLPPPFVCCCTWGVSRGPVWVPAGGGLTTPALLTVLALASLPCWAIASVGTMRARCQSPELLVGSSWTSPLVFGTTPGCYGWRSYSQQVTRDKVASRRREGGGGGGGGGEKWTMFAVHSLLGAGAGAVATEVLLDDVKQMALGHVLAKRRGMWRLGEGGGDFGHPLDLQRSRVGDEGIFPVGEAQRSPGSMVPLFPSRDTSLASQRASADLSSTANSLRVGGTCGTMSS